MASTTITKMYWLQAITPLHVGAGKGVGFIDMPIMREKVTNWPFVPGSAVKGVLRDHFTQIKDLTADESTQQTLDERIKAAFGEKGTDLESNAGSLVLTDAHIVCMPVRSLYGTFAYVTSPMVLARLMRDLEAAGYTGLLPIPDPGDETVFTAKDPKILSSDQPHKIFFEDLDFTAVSGDAMTDAWARYLSVKIFPSDSDWQSAFNSRLAIVSDNTFTFLSQQGSEVTAHIKIDETRKIVKRGALWYEEALPSETILAGIAWCDRVYRNGVKQNDLVDTFCGKELKNIQIGGKATVGKGRARCLFTQG
jgi:CRISPR-associated protein Cmr4